MERPIVICQEVPLGLGYWSNFVSFVWHLVWKVGTKVVVLGSGRRGSFGEAG